MGACLLISTDERVMKIPITGSLSYLVTNNWQPYKLHRFSELKCGNGYHAFPFHTKTMNRHNIEPSFQLDVAKPCYYRIGFAINYATTRTTHASNKHMNMNHRMCGARVRFELGSEIGTVFGLWVAFLSPIVPGWDRLMNKPKPTHMSHTHVCSMCDRTSRLWWMIQTRARRHRHTQNAWNSRESIANAHAQILRGACRNCEFHAHKSHI